MVSADRVVVAGRYELARRLGEGGMGEVYEALDRQTQRKVAVKRLRDQRGMSEELAARFAREILATAQITSRHVVAIHDAGVDEVPFLVMDYLEGEDVGVVADRLGILPVELAVALVAQVCEGLVAAHAIGIVHRDIKPSNLILVAPASSGARLVKIVDFGIARIRFADREVDPLTDLTRTGVIVGSPTYMAPEQLRGKKTLDHRADLWSLGVVLYRLLCGQLPHASDSVADLLVTVCSEPAPPLQARAPWVPDELAALVHALLAIDPARRPASARDVAARLEPYLPPGGTITDAMVVAYEPPARERAPRDTAPAPGAAARPSTLAIAEPAPPAAARPSLRSIAEPSPRPPTSVDEPRRPRSATLALLVVLAAVVAFAIVFPRRAGGGDEPAPAPVVMPANLANSAGAAWFERVRARCTASRARAVVADTPPPHTPDGAAFAAACAALAGDPAFARELVEQVDRDDRAYAAGPMFLFAHALADRHNDDPDVGEIMRIVIDAWPDNYQALYAAGLVEFQRADARAEAHLRAFLQLYPRDDSFAQAARHVLAVLAAPARDCGSALVDGLGHSIAIPGC